MTIRVAIADDQAMVRAGVALIVRAQPDMEVVGEAGDGEQAVQVVADTRPDVVLMDVRMPNVDGLEATRRLLGGPARDDGTRVIVLTTFDLDAYVYEALLAGASGFVLKDAPPEQLVAAIRVAAAGDALVAPSVTRRLIERYVRPQLVAATEGPLADLTAREREVLTLIAAGLSNAEIADRLVVSDATVKTHVGHVFAKLGLRDRAQAVVVAYESGLVRPRAGGV